MELRAYLDQENITPAAFARTIKVSVQAVHRYLSNDRFPRQEILKAITEVTQGKVTANDLCATAKPQASAA